MSSLAEILEAGVDREHSAYSSFELSLNSAEGMGRLQFTHIHLCSDVLSPLLRRKLSREKASAVWNAIEEISRAAPGWPLALCRRLLRELTDFYSVGPLLPFSFEYDLCRRRVVKISLYASGDPACLRLLAALMGASDCSWVEQESKQELDVVGVDFWPDGRAALKVYELHRFSPDRILDPRIRALSKVVAQFHSVRDMIFLRRTTSRGALLPLSKVCLRLRDGVPGEALASLPAMGLYDRFLLETSMLLRGLRVYYLSFDVQFNLELCARRGRPAWRSARAVET